MTTPIRFDDGAAYERFMGQWSRPVGEAFLRWLAPAPGLTWLDVGCGNGAFTELLVERVAPVRVLGVDPSAEQLAFARTRPLLKDVEFRQGDGQALPYDNDSVDAAVLPLVIFFLPSPATGVAELARVVRPGGLVSAYAWDMPGGGFPYASLLEEIGAMGLPVPRPPSDAASSLEELRQLWTGAGLEGVETTSITVERSFADFGDYWATIQGSPSVGNLLRSLSPADTASLQGKLQARHPAGAGGRLVLRARANAVRGRVAGRGR